MLRRLRGDRELRRAAVFDDPQAAFANLARILGLGGRLVLACWQELVTKDWLMVPATAASAYVPRPDLGEPGRPGPFWLADPDRVRSRSMLPRKTLIPLGAAAALVAYPVSTRACIITTT